MPLESIEQTIDTDADQWQARVDLAAAHRLAVLHGFHEGIFNHLTLRVPGYMAAKVGDSVHVKWSPDSVHLFDAATEQRVV